MRGNYVGILYLSDRIYSGVVGCLRHQCREDSIVGRETMSPSLQGAKVGSKTWTISEVGVHFIPLFTDSERSRKREQVNNLTINFPI
jgi:hypothetical protein